MPLIEPVDGPEAAADEEADEPPPPPVALLETGVPRTAARTAAGVPARRAQPVPSGPDGSQTTSPMGTSAAAASAPRPGPAGAPASRTWTRTTTATSMTATQSPGENQQPMGLGVAAGPEGVDERHRPADVRQPVRDPPGAVAEPRLAPGW